MSLKTTGHIQYASDSTNTILPAVLHFPAFPDDGIEMLMELDGLQNSKGIKLIKDVNASLLYPDVTWIGSMQEWDDSYCHNPIDWNSMFLDQILHVLPQ